MEKVKEIIGVSIIPIAWTMLVRALGETRIEIKDTEAHYHTYRHRMGFFLDDIEVQKIIQRTGEVISTTSRRSLFPMTIDHQTFQK